MEIFRALKWLEPVVELSRLGCFAVFVALALWHLRAVRVGEPDRVVRFRARMLIAFVIVVSTVAGVTQIEAWPFSNWTLVHTYRSRAMTSWAIEGFDANGHTSEIDPRVLQPLQPEEFGAWTLTHLERLTPDDRELVLRFLLDRGNTQRARFLAGHFPANDYLLGDLSAPAHFAMRRVWRTPSDVPPGPFVAVRIVRLRWDTEGRDRNSGAFHRELLAEYRAR